MRTFLTAALWFLAVWVSFDIACYVMGFPRSATPIVALVTGTGVAVWLRIARDGEAAPASA